MTTLVALQLKPALFVSMLAMCSAWYAISLVLQGPGTTITGLTLPNSPVICLFNSGVLASLRTAPSAPVPKTIASKVLSDPVIWRLGKYLGDDLTIGPGRYGYRNFGVPGAFDIGK